MKVCHLSSVHYAMDTRIFYKMCQALKEDYEVTLIAHHPQKETVNGVHIIPFKVFRNRNVRVLFSWLLMFRLAIKQKAQIYHFHDPELIPCGILLSMLGKKVIYDVHENIAEDIFDKPWIRNQKMAFKIFNFFNYFSFYIKLLSLRCVINSLIHLNYRHLPILLQILVLVFQILLLWY